MREKKPETIETVVRWCGACGVAVRVAEDNYTCPVCMADDVTLWDKGGLTDAIDAIAAFEGEE